MAKKPFVRIMEALGRIEQMLDKVLHFQTVAMRQQSTYLPERPRVETVRASVVTPAEAPVEAHEAATREACHKLVDELIKIHAIRYQTAWVDARTLLGEPAYRHVVQLDVVIREEGRRV